MSVKREIYSTEPEVLFDRKLECEVMRLTPGDYLITEESRVLTTVLGSCVSACIRDSKIGVGGMNHFMLPETQLVENMDAATAGRYGSHAMQRLIDGIIELGGNLSDLEVKLFGGGQIVDGMTDVGERNIRFVRRYLEEAGIDVAAEDLGLTFPRKINYFVETGRVMVRKLRSLHNRSICAEEEKLRADLRSD